MLRWFPKFQVATTCVSCSPPDLNLLVTNFIFCIHVKQPLPPGDNTIEVNKYYFYFYYYKTLYVLVVMMFYDQSDSPWESNSAETRFFHGVQIGTEANPASYSIWTGSFAGAKRTKRGVDHKLHLVLGCKLAAAIPRPSFYAGRMTFIFNAYQCEKKMDAWNWSKKCICKYWNKLHKKNPWP